MSRTLSGTYTTGVTLTSTGDNPVTIDGTAALTPDYSTPALYAEGGSGQAWTISNAGVINAGTYGTGIQLGATNAYVGASVITNDSGGTIEGVDGIHVIGTPGSSVTNLSGGTIAATGGDGVYFNWLGTVANSGVISAPTGGDYCGVLMLRGGTVINNVGGTISGQYGVILDAAGTVANAGTIASASAGAYAVSLFGVDSRLIVDPGAVFQGAVYGGQGTMEMASASVAGTLTATNFSNFTAIEFDAGSQWTLIGNATALAGGIQGFSTGDTLDLAGFAAVSEAFASNKLVLTDAAHAHATLAIQGSFSTINFLLGGDGGDGTDITLQGGTLVYGETVDAQGIVATSETVNAGGTLTLLNGGNPVGTIAVGTSLSTGDFTLQSDGAGGTDIVVSTVFGTYANGVTLSVDTTTVAGSAGMSGTASSVTAVYGPSGTAWAVINQASIQQTGASTYGVSFAGGGTVTNATGGTIEAEASGVKLDGAGAAVTNLGWIASGAAGGLGEGIYLPNGGAVINGASGGTVSAAYVNGYRNGVDFGSSNAGTLTNYGTVGGFPGGTGVSMVTGTVVNGPGGATAARLAGGGSGVLITGAGTVVNYATISAGGYGAEPEYGVKLGGAGSVSDLGPKSVIYGYVGIYAQSNDTITTGGTIASNHGTSTSSYDPVYGTAIQFGGGTNALIVNPGAVFTGSIKAAGITTLELTSASSAGTLAGLGGTITNFSTLEFDPGASWTVAGNGSASGLGTLEITGFDSRDTIDLIGFDAVGWSYANAQLTVTNAVAATETLNFAGSSFTTNSFAIATNGSDSDITVCYRAGTRIATPSGERAVEQLRIGDPVLTRGGTAKPVKWIGYRRHAAAKVAVHAQLRPVLIRHGALAAGLPHRDLFVSAMHAMFIDDMFIPAAALINGVTIRRCDEVVAVEYVHIELEDHAVIFAEGAPAETFVDVNSRRMFDNAGEYYHLYGAEKRSRGFCAPRTEHGFLLEGVRRRLAKRANLPAFAAVPGKLLGHVERFENGVLQGWAMDDDNRTIPVELDVLVDGESVGALLANQYRTDLDRAGLAGGRCAFSMVLPGAASNIGRVTTRRVSDRINLPVAPDCR